MKKRIGACLVLLGLLVIVSPAAQIVPMAVSPGSERGVALVGQVCPTFSWTAVDWASGYRVAVFEALGVQVPTYEEMAVGAVPALRKDIAGRALSWTPSSEEQLIAGSLYVWYVQAADGSGQGTWSKGKLFIVKAGVIASGTEGLLRQTLEEKGVREDVITDVLREMKVEGQGVISGKTDSKPQGKVGALGSEGPNNVLYGTSAGASITSGLYNTFIGLSAGYFNTTASYNTFLGYAAGYNNTTGASNTFIGNAAGYSNTTGGNNTFFGYRAGYRNSTGSSNTFVGNYAGYSNYGSYNTFLGYYSGENNTTGGRNTFLGYNAGSFNTTAWDNVFLGYEAGYSNTTGNSCVFLGNQAGRANTTGVDNTFIGDQAGYSNTAGSYNLCLGLAAGANNLGGDYNTCIGHYAGYSTTGDNSVFLGFQAGQYETGSNKLYIANSYTSNPLIYGDFSSKILGVNGWLGVGTQSPAYPMEVKTTGRNSVLVVQRSDGGAMNFMNASLAYGQFGTGNGYPVRILVNSMWRMSLNLDNSLTMVNGASCTAGGVWTDASSRELKENIEDLSAAEAEEALRALAPVKYNYKADKEERHVGFIAEDVPELVASKDRKTMSPMNVVGVLTKIVQELERKSEEQEKLIREQQKTIAELKERVEKLQKGGR
jgi:hypothetical protein